MDLMILILYHFVGESKLYNISRESRFLVYLFSTQYENYEATYSRDEFLLRKFNHLTLQKLFEAILILISICDAIFLCRVKSRMIELTKINASSTVCRHFKALKRNNECSLPNLDMMQRNWPIVVLRDRNESDLGHISTSPRHREERVMNVEVSRDLKCAIESGAVENCNIYDKICKQSTIKPASNAKQIQTKLELINCKDKIHNECIGLLKIIKCNEKESKLNSDCRKQCMKFNSKQYSLTENIEKLNSNAGESHVKDGNEKSKIRPYLRDSRFRQNEKIGLHEQSIRGLLTGIHFRFPPQEIQVYMVPAINLPHPNVVCGMLWHMFKRELNRMRTFAKYPISSPKSSLLLASEGFLYIGSGENCDDHVICYFCCRQKKNWKLLDSVGSVHRELSPDCPMVTGIGCDNEPIASQRPSVVSEAKVNNTPRNIISGVPILTNATNLLETDAALETSHPSGARYSEVPCETKTVQFAIRSFARPLHQTTILIQQPPVISSTQSSSGRSSVPVPSNSAYNNLSGSQAFPTIHTLLSERPASEQFVTTQSLTSTSIATPTTPDLLGSITPHHSEQYLDISPAVSPSVSATVSPTVSATVSDAHGHSRNGVNRPQNMAASSEVTIPTETLQTASGPSNGNALANTTTNATSNPPNPQGSTSNPPNPQGSTSNPPNTKAPTYAELGIITERPKRTEYAPKITRLRSFESWPRDHRLTPAQLAEAGFYYAGYGDCARCFYCGGGLRNWEDEDDVWVEHARWFPKCAYIRQQMGQAFVDTVQELNKQYTVITYEDVINRTGQAAVYMFGSKESPLKNDAAVKTLVAMGYPERDVLFAAKLVKEEFNIVSSDSILERLIKDGCQYVNAASSFDPLTASNPSETLEKIQTLKEKNNQLRQQTVCKICMDKEVAVLFLPCGHLISCAECASAMKDCPLCRKPVKGVVRAFIS